MLSDAEYAVIQSRADRYEREAEEHMRKGNPKHAQLHATLALSARLEVIGELLRDQPTRVETTG